MIEMETAIKHTIFIDGEHLTLEQVLLVARNKAVVKLHVSGKEKLLRSRKIVERIISSGEVAYGITTGFGKFSDVSISKEDCDTLQKNIIMSHSCGIGEPLPQEAVRAMMLLRANSLVKGYSGVRLELVELLLNMLNSGIHPLVPCKGSVGASGDLIPLSHIALAMIGLGEVEYSGKKMSSKDALQLAGLRPISLTAKEGLALINGTQYMSALGCLAVSDALELFKAASVAAAMSFEALEEESDRLKMRCFEEIKKTALEKRKKRDSEKQPVTTREGNGVYVTKKTVNISIANIFHGAKTIESEEDIEELLDYLRKQLKTELKENTILKLI
jgi:histidine ammonia-lyase